MNKKYKYTGQRNDLCPVCNSRIMTGSPVIYFISGKRQNQHHWCGRCIEDVHRITSSLRTEKSIELYLPELTKLARKALQLDTDYHVTGFWFALVPNQGLTLVVEVSDG